MTHLLDTGTCIDLLRGQVETISNAATHPPQRTCDLCHHRIRTALRRKAMSGRLAGARIGEDCATSPAASHPRLHLEGSHGGCRDAHSPWKCRTSHRFDGSPPCGHSDDRPTHPRDEQSPRVPTHPITRGRLMAAARRDKCELETPQPPNATSWATLRFPPKLDRRAPMPLESAMHPSHGP